MGVIEGAASGAAMGSVVPGIGTVAGGLVGGVMGLFGGDDEEEADVLAPPPPNGPQFGGQYWGGRSYDMNNGVAVPGTSGADIDVNRYRGIGEAAANRGAYQLDYGNANASMGQANAARAEQVQAANMARSAAMGNAPSRAELLGRNMIDQSLQAQLAGAAGARGGSLGQAAAMRNAQMGAAAFQQQGGQQLAALRADEMDRARAQYAGQLGAIRGQDFAGAQNYAAMAQQQGQMELQQRQMNDNRSMGMERLGFDTRNAAMTGDQGYAKIQAERQRMRDDASAKEREQDMDLAAAGIGAAASLGGAAIKGGAAEGGPVEGGSAYVVGERGPELIVPANDGFVIPSQGEVSDQDESMLMSTERRPRLSSSGPMTEKKASLAQAAAQKAKAPAAVRPLSPAELRAAADRLEQQMGATHQAMMAQGPAVRPSMGEVAASEIGKLRMAHAQGAISDQELALLMSHGNASRSAILMGGREDPYASLMGGREDPYR
jgi:hypothetical protein